MLLTFEDSRAGLPKRAVPNVVFESVNTGKPIIASHKQGVGVGVGWWGGDEDQVTQMPGSNRNFSVCNLSAMTPAPAVGRCGRRN